MTSPTNCDLGALQASSPENTENRGYGQLRSHAAAGVVGRNRFIAPVNRAAPRTLRFGGDRLGGAAQ